MNNKEKSQKKRKFEPSDDCSGEEPHFISVCTGFQLRVSLIFHTLVFKRRARSCKHFFLFYSYKENCKQRQLYSLLHFRRLTSGTNFCNIIQPDHMRPAESWSWCRIQLLFNFAGNTIKLLCRLASSCILIFRRHLLLTALHRLLLGYLQIPK